ncbi:MAG TPA: phage virion morphogenesis protein [Ktedonobacteraceae bacterium]|nr:phage virion morphogenesis protein [Ktedonobacteraceae bacterium]
MLSITVTVTGLDRVNERLSALGASLHDFSGALSLLGRQLIMFYSDTVMNSQGTALGSRWAPLADSTQAYKSSHWPGRGPLVRTGTMQQSFTSTATPDTLFVTNTAPYFPYHQLGTRKMPQRSMIGVNATVETMIKTVLQADIAAKIASTNA